ncbi:phosphoadenosine phosphosulfate reductase [Xinfangfangia sp. CPCC 101601]|uniref:Phosphoadenosine phosphosulfate reductase n=1 Tax=Pseudogemmobacter lacusdianii TaxID=3069608 RepID=A0ABU0W2E4_9RHOB|nr:phosphoadenosine phosphosulfate reductase [Xinfangfangia sp. CPCC 101601]MDQ2068078.1 phosphoadenosine phosphosulfate reductase [Xinfangfangia sp. CPCC 101601]
MSDQPLITEADLTPAVTAGASDTAWLQAMDAIAEDDGYLEPLGKKHWAFFAEDRTTLLVTFERAEAIRSRPDKLPAAYAMCKERGWSLLTVIAEGETWWRDRAVWGYFDRLVDDAFFDDFDKVLFMGAGPAGHAACAYAVTAPGCSVLAIAPRATQDPQIVGWDKRDLAARRMDFTSRYGYAPDMTEGAGRVWLLHDPLNALDAMHAALFRAPWVTALKAPHTRDATERALSGMQILEKIIEEAMAGSLTEASFAKLWRARRDSSPWLRGLLAHVAAQDRPKFEEMICRSVVKRMRAPRFAARLEQLAAAEIAKAEAPEAEQS